MRDLFTPVLRLHALCNLTISCVDLDAPMLAAFASIGTLRKLTWQDVGFRDVSPEEVYRVASHVAPSLTDVACMEPPGRGTVMGRLPRAIRDAQAVAKAARLLQHAAANAAWAYGMLRHANTEANVSLVVPDTAVPAGVLDSGAGRRTLRSLTLCLPQHSSAAWCRDALRNILADTLVIRPLRDIPADHAPSHGDLDAATLPHAAGTAELCVCCLFPDALRGVAEDLAGVRADAVKDIPHLVVVLEDWPENCYADQTYVTLWSDLSLMPFRKQTITC